MCCCITPEICHLWVKGVVGLIKGVLLTPLLIVITAPSTFILAVLLLPHDIFYSFYTLAVTNRIGPNLKVAAMLLLPLPLCAWPLFVLVGTVAGWLVYGLFGQILEDRCSLEQAGAMLGNTSTFIVDFYDFNTKSVFEYLADCRRRSEGAPFDIGICQILVSLLQGTVCVVVETATYACLGALKLPFVMLRCEWFLVSGYINMRTADECRIVCCPCWIVSLLVTPVLCIFAYALAILSGFGAVNCAICAYGTGNFVNGFKMMANHIHDFDEKTSSIIINDQASSCFPEFHIEGRRDRSIGTLLSDPNRTVIPRQTPLLAGYGSLSNPESSADIEAGISSTAPTASSDNPLAWSRRHILGADGVTMDAIWNSFFRMCTDSLLQCLAAGTIATAEVEALEPCLIIGTPAIVAFRCVSRSLSKTNATGASESAANVLVLHDGVEVNETNRPHNYAADVVWSQMLQIKSKLQEADLSAAEQAQFEKALIRNDIDCIDKGALKGAVHEHGQRTVLPSLDTAGKGSGDDPKAERLVVLAQLMASVNNVAVHVSRLPQFKRRFGGVAREVSTKTTAAK
jgi:hypothetical protein